jgi:hypothetical protein
VSPHRRVDGTIESYPRVDRKKSAVNPGLWDATPSALNPALKLELPGYSRSILAETKTKLPTVSSVSSSQGKPEAAGFVPFNAATCNS